MVLGMSPFCRIGQVTESAEVRGPITFHRGEALLYGMWHLVSHNARKPVRKEALR